MIEVTHKPRRPGGLTALAILNIIFALAGAVGGLAMAGMSSQRDEIATQIEETTAQAEAQRPSEGQDEATVRAINHGMIERIRTWSPTGYRVVMALGYSGGLLLFLSAFGLFGQRRWMGKQFALVSGVALIACAAVAMTTLSFLFWSFPFIGGGYAIVLIALTQTVYKRTLVH